MAEPTEGERQPVDGAAAFDRIEIQAHRDDSDGQERHDLDRHSPANELYEHPDSDDHGGHCVIGWNFQHVPSKRGCLNKRRL